MSKVSPTTTPETSLGPDLEPGSKVGEYEVDTKLGQGGFGAVWKGTHPLIGKQVAIKVLARRFSVDPEMVSRFVAEARAVNQIRHRHIVDIFAFGYLDDGRAYYVMEYLDGETLDARIDLGAVPLADAIPILRGIARALDAAHAKGIAHRDLKAENVLVARDDDGAPFPKLLDFGIAKLMQPEDGTSHKTRTGAPIGTPHYMSPEQCRGRDVDHRTDYYAFGVLAYRMLTGTYPHDGDDYMSILMLQMTVEPEPASSRDPALPAGVDDVIAWLMKKSAADRPPNLVTAIAALEAAAAKAGIVVATATPTSLVPVPRLTPLGLRAPSMTDAAALAERPSRRWLPVAIVAVGAAIAATILIIGLGHDEPATPRAVTPVAAVVDASRVDAPPAITSDVARTITLTVTGAPEGTEAVVAGVVVGTLPHAIELDRGDASIDVVFRHAGFFAATRSIVPDRDRTLAVTLERARPVAPATPARPPHDPHSPENPFP